MKSRTKVFHFAFQTYFSTCDRYVPSCTIIVVAFHTNMISFIYRITRVAVSRVKEDVYNVGIFSSKISNDSAFFLTTFRTIQSVYIYSLYFCRKRLRKDFENFGYSTRGNEQKDLGKHGSKKHLFRSYETFLSVRHYLCDICSIRSPIISTHAFRHVFSQKHKRVDPRRLYYLLAGFFDSPY